MNNNESIKVGDKVIEAGLTVVDGKLVDVQLDYVVTYSKDGVVAGRLNGKGREVALFNYLKA